MVKIKTTIIIKNYLPPHLEGEGVNSYLDKMRRATPQNQILTQKDKIKSNFVPTKIGK